MILNIKYYVPCGMNHEYIHMGFVHHYHVLIYVTKHSSVIVLMHKWMNNLKILYRIILKVLLLTMMVKLRCPVYFYGTMKILIMVIQYRGHKNIIKEINNNIGILMILNIFHIIGN